MTTVNKIAIGLLCLIGVVVLVYGVLAFSQLQKPETQVACTLEGKVCPDGTVVGRIGPNCEFAACPEVQGKAFGSDVTVAIGKSITFSDNLVVTLESIDDSRCKQGVTCIWAGELSPVLELKGGNIQGTLDVRLGTTTRPSITQNGYTVTLKEVTETKATITITKK